jgi:hypothetical protein
MEMKISLQLPSGLQISFEGNEAAFDRFTEFLAEPPGFVENLGVSAPALANGTVHELEQGTSEDAPEQSDDPLSSRVLHDRLREVGATTDIERVTVIAQAAVDAGKEAVDYSTVDRLYVELGLPKPARWAKTFSNAKARNLVRSVGHGVWRPTVVGENFARFGARDSSRSRSRRSASGERPGLPAPEGEPS